MVKELKQAEFDAFVSGSDKPVLIDFWAVWCGPCRMLSPVVEDVAQAMEGQLHVGKVNVDECPDIAKKFGIMSIPTLILFKDGQMVDKQIGYMPKQQLEQMVQKAL